MVRINRVTGRLVRIDEHLIAVLGEDRGEREHAVVISVTATRVPDRRSLGQWNPFTMERVSGVCLIEIA